MFPRDPQRHKIEISRHSPRTRLRANSLKELTENLDEIMTKQIENKYCPAWKTAEEKWLPTPRTREATKNFQVIREIYSAHS